VKTLYFVLGFSAVLAFGLLGLPGAAAATPTCSAHVNVTVPAQVFAGTPSGIRLSVSPSTSTCYVVASQYTLYGMPSGPMVTHNSIVVITPPTTGLYHLSVVAETNMGALSTHATILVTPNPL
jgi:hypothetical protein